MQIKLPVHEKGSQLSTLPSNPIYQSQSTQPCVPIQPSLPPYQTQSHNAHLPSQESHLPSQESHLPSQVLQQPSIDVFRSTSGHETSNVPDAAGTKFNVAKSHEQHVANAAWSEDLPSNTTMPDKLSSPISPNCMFSFLFMNIAHLYAKYRQKNKLLADYCDSSTMFICLCETFLHEGMLDSEVQMPSFIIVRSDGVSRPGGGVCLYLRKNLIYKICLKYSNSVCDLLIVKILSPDLIIILVYRPPSSPLSDFDDIITKTREFILSLPAPLPNIILLADFNMPEVIWDNPHAYNPSSELLIDLTTLLFLNQQLSTPTRKSNVLDLIFDSDELINSIDVPECSSSDHCLIKTETYIPVDPITIQTKCINPSLTSFEKFDFNRSDWINLSQSLKFTNWIHELDQVSPNEILPVAMNNLISKCSIHVPLKRPKEARKSQFQKERRVLMRKRTKLSRIILRTPQIISQLLSIEEQICSSHLKVKIFMKNMLLFLKSRLILSTSLGILKDTVFVNRRLVHCSTH